jgi:hypothetical protein
MAISENVMTIRTLSVLGAATALIIAVACADDRPTPVSPESVTGGEAGAAADGSTMKVTPPAAIAPTSGAEVKTNRPVFSVTNSQARFGATPSLEYRFEVQTESGQAVMSAVVPGGDGTTSWQAATALAQGSYKWRSRAETAGRHGPWSEFVLFKMVAPPSLLPDGPYPTSPIEIVQFVERSYPDRGRARVSLAKRKEDMAFLRDRIIEVALCVGLEMGRNLKRGGPEHSYDFLAYKTGGRTWGVDIAGGYDDTKQRLRLSWRMHAPRAFFDPIPNPEPCRN